jgi:hypothetical protein
LENAINDLGDTETAEAVAAVTKEINNLIARL